MINRQESIFFENGGHVDFNHIDDKLLYRIIRHEFIGSHPSNPDIQNVDRTYAEGIVFDETKFKEEMENMKTVEDALEYISKNNNIVSNSINNKSKDEKND